MNGRIHLAPPGTASELVLGGMHVGHLVSGFTLRHVVGEPTVLTLHMPTGNGAVDVVLGDDPTVRLQMPPEMEALLVAAGWEPPGEVDEV